VANSGFCITCVFFGGESTHNASKLQWLMTSALPPSASAVQKPCQHGEKSNVLFTQRQLSVLHSLSKWSRIRHLVSMCSWEKPTP
jgi:hypothetical protein